MTKVDRIRAELRAHGARAFLEARTLHGDALRRMLADVKAPCRTCGGKGYTRDMVPGRVVGWDTAQCHECCDCHGGGA